MSIPSQTEMFGIVLDLASKNNEFTRRELKDKAKESLCLTDDEALMATSSGIPIYESRVGWAISYLARAGLFDHVARGTYCINERGRSYLDKDIEPSEFFSIIRTIIEEENPWNTGNDEDAVGNLAESISSDDSSAQSPEEEIGQLELKLNDFLGSELLTMIMERDPSFFEKVVVDLIEKMGYGNGSVTQKSCDFGIDGMISTDELGFHPIYTQAKRYAPDHKISRPDVQSFIGALNGAHEGVFITTSSFTKEAEDFAKNYPNASVALIDGQRLTQLMIKYNLGVSTERVIEIKRIDLDYFDL